MRLLPCSASVALSPAQANCLSLGEINSSQVVDIGIGLTYICPTLENRESRKLCNIGRFN
jgi:hypothetical protein